MKRQAFIIASAIGFIVRVAQLPIDRIPLGDNLNYWLIADNILHGRGLLFVDPILGPQRAFFPPLYPLLLSATLLNPIAIVALNYCFDLLAAVAMMWIGRLQGHERPAAIAAAIYLFWPTNVLLDPYPQKEGLVAFLCVASAALVLSRRWRSLGLAWGALILSQPALAPLPALFVILLIPWREWRSTAQSALVVVACLLPWWIRNWVVLGAFVPLTTSGGLSLWIGVVPGGTGSWVPPPMRFAIGEIAGNRAAAGEALRIIAADPLGAMYHALFKLLHISIDNSWPSRAYRFSAPRPTAEVAAAAYSTIIANWLLLLSSPLARGRPGRLVIGALLQIVLFQSWFELDERHRYFLTPFLLLNILAYLMPTRRKPTFRLRSAASDSMSTLFERTKCRPT